MKLHNKTSYGLQHVVTKTDKDGRTTKITYTLACDEVKEIPQEVANVWMKINGVEEYVAPADLKKAEEKAKAEKEALEKENAELKAELEKLKKAEEKAKAKTK